MKVVVDTSVWSLALRRNTPANAMPVVKKLRDLITDGRVAMLGAVRQEVLSGIRHAEQFAQLRDYLRAFVDLGLTTEDYELAAEFYNTSLEPSLTFPRFAFSPARTQAIFSTSFHIRPFHDHVRLYICFKWTKERKLCCIRSGCTLGKAAESLYLQSLLSLWFIHIFY